MDVIEQLGQVMAQVGLKIAPVSAGFLIQQANSELLVPSLPLADLDPTVLKAELLAVAAGIDAALTLVAAVDEETFRQGAATLLCRLERRRFVQAFNAIADAGQRGDHGQLLSRDFGADLAITYIREEGWRFSYLTVGHRLMWDASPDAVASCARSNLYASRDIDMHATTVAFGDGSDATRAILTGDVFFGRQNGPGVPIAIPGRDTLLIGPEHSAEDVAAAYDQAEYPLSRARLSFRRGKVETR